MDVHAPSRGARWLTGAVALAMLMGGCGDGGSTSAPASVGWVRAEVEASPVPVNDLVLPEAVVTEEGFLFADLGLPPGAGPILWRSSNGTDWDLVEPGALGELQERAGVAELPTGTAVEMLAAGDPCGTEPGRVRRQADGVADVIELPGGPGRVQAVAAAGGRLFAAGKSSEGGGATVWTSADGTTWDIASKVDAFGRPGTDHVEFVCPLYPELGAQPLDLAGVGDVVVMAVVWPIEFVDLACYTNARTCGLQRFALLTTSDGATWEQMALPAELPFPPGDAAVAAIGDRLILVIQTGPGFEIWWRDGPGERTPFEPLAVADLPYDVVEGGGTIEVGVEYAFPFFAHCGIDYLGELNGVHWTLLNEPSSAPAEASWPRQQDVIYGTLELVAADRIEYRVPAGTIAVYQPGQLPDVGCA